MPILRILKNLEENKLKINPLPWNAYNFSNFYFSFPKEKKKDMLGNFSISFWELSLTLQGAGMTDASCQLSQLAVVNSAFTEIGYR